jgi:NADH-quinone oxidoreductase subunit M
MMSNPLILLLVLPLVAAAALWALPERMARGVTLGAALLGLAISFVVLAAFDPAQAGFQLVAEAPWIPGLQAYYRVGVDGLAVGFLPVAQLLLAAMVMCTGTVSRARLFYALVLVLHFASLGIFVALDALFFFLCWELTLVPLFFLAALWGLGPQRRQAATQYLLIMLAGGIPLLFAFVLLAFAHAQSAGVLSFDLRDWLTLPLPRDAQVAVFLLLFVAFAVKLPVFPLHSWLPALALEGPAGVLALVTGLKFGAWGLIRYAVPLAPDLVRELHWLLAGCGVAGILFGAAAALAQTNLRAMLAYSSVSHVGFVLLGIASLNLVGLQGAVLQLLNFGIVAGALGLLLGILHRETGSNDLVSLGGLARRMPLLASAFLLFGLAGMGIPGTSGFPAELLILLAIFKVHGGAALAALVGGVMGAAYFIGSWRRAFLGPLRHPPRAAAGDLRPAERWAMGVFALLVLFFGVAPDYLLRLIEASAQVWAARVG